MRLALRPITREIILLSILFVFTALMSSKSDVQAPNGLEIMTRVDQRDDGDDQQSTALFQLVNKRGQKRLRHTVRLWKDYDGADGLDAKMITFFQSPPDVKGTGFLSWSYVAGEKDDDQWLYLPALRKVRRIASSDKGDSFMGTDFTYDDMGERKVEEDNHTLLRSEPLRDADCYVVDSVPKKEGYIYSKKITWVDKANWIPLKVDYYDRKGRLLKTLETEWQIVNGIWSWLQAEMKNHLTGHKTLIEIKDVKVNTGLANRTFTKRTLEKGVRRR